MIADGANDAVIADAAVLTVDVDAAVADAVVADAIVERRSTMWLIVTVDVTVEASGTLGVANVDGIEKENVVFGCVQVADTGVEVAVDSAAVVSAGYRLVAVVVGNQLSMSP